jgi:hypothetical protein
VNPALSSALLDLSSISDVEAEKLTHQEYVKLYMDRQTRKGKIGIRKTHDGEDVLFNEWRFDHAFFESAYKTSRKYNKGKFSRSRACRIRWIGEVIAGNIKGCECYEIPDLNRRDPMGKVMIKRLYVLWEERYFVWLEPHQKGGWWFSSAYIDTRSRSYIKRNILAGGVLRKIISRD